MAANAGAMVSHVDFVWPPLCSSNNGMAPGEEFPPLRSPQMIVDAVHRLDDNVQAVLNLVDG